jgi:membrane protein
MVKVWTLARRTFKEFMDDDCMQIAASIAYFTIFSLFPLIIFLVAVLGLVFRDELVQRQFIENVLTYIPLSQGTGTSGVEDAIRRAVNASATVSLFSLAGMAWSASNVFNVVRKSVNRAFDLKPQRSFIKQKLIDFAMLLVLPIAFLASIAATGFVTAVRAWGDTLPLIGGLSQATGFLWSFGSIFIPLVLSFVAILVLYWAAPAPRIDIRDLWPGALIAAIAFEIAKVAFGFYVANFGNYSAIYGSLGAAVALLFWIYVSAIILLVGAELNSEYPKVFRGEPAKLADPEAPSDQAERAAA